MAFLVLTAVMRQRHVGLQARPRRPRDFLGNPRIWQSTRFLIEIHGPPFWISPRHLNPDRGCLRFPKPCRLGLFPGNLSLSAWLYVNWADSMVRDRSWFMYAVPISFVCFATFITEWFVFWPKKCKTNNRTCGWRAPVMAAEESQRMSFLVGGIRMMSAVVQAFNLLKLTGYLMHQQFNIQQLYVLPTQYLCVLYLSENKQRLVPLTS